MQTYTVTDPQSGRTLKLQGESPPTEQELVEVFASYNTEVGDETVGVAAGVEGAMGATPMGALTNMAAPIGQMVADAGTPAAGAAAFGRVGANPTAVRLTRGVSIPLSMGLGAGLGSEINRRAQGRDFAPGRFAADVATGMIPGPKMAGQSLRQLAGLPGVLGAGQNAIVGTAESLMDTGRFPSIGEYAALIGSGYAGPTGGKLLGKAFGGKTVKEPLDPQEALAKRAVRNFARANKRGLEVAPRAMGRGNPIETFVAGKEVTDNIVSARNAPKIQAMVRSDVGLSNKPDAISFGELETITKKAEVPFEQAAAVSTEAKELVDGIKLNRAKANRLYGPVSRNEPGAFEQWDEVKGQIKASEDALEDVLDNAGKGGLAKDIKKNRITLAKISALRDAWNKSTGVVDGIELGKRYKFDNFKDSLTGEMRIAADFANSFPDANKQVGLFASRAPLTGSTHYSAVQAASGSPRGIFAAVLENSVGRGVRPFMLTQSRQRKLLVPRYKPTAETDPAGVFGRLGLMGAGRTQQEDPYIRR